MNDICINKDSYATSLKKIVTRTFIVTLPITTVSSVLAFVNRNPVGLIATSSFGNTVILSSTFFTAQQYVAQSRGVHDVWNSLFAGAISGSLLYGVKTMSQQQSARGGVLMTVIGFCGYYFNEKFYDFKAGMAIRQLKKKNGKDFDTSHVLPDTAYNRVRAELTRYYVPLFDSGEPGQGAETEKGVGDKSHSEKKEMEWFPIKSVEKKSYR